MAVADVVPLKPEHQQHISWESNNVESQRANVKEKAAIRNSNLFLKSIQDFNKALAQQAEYIKERFGSSNLLMPINNLLLLRKQSRSVAENEINPS